MPAVSPVLFAVAVMPKPKNRILYVPPTRSLKRESDDEDESDDEGAVPSTSGISHKKTATSVPFKLLSRDKRGRLEARELYVPQDNAMVIKMQKTEEIIRLEKQRLKEKVLLLHKNSVGQVEQSLEQIYGHAASSEGSESKAAAGPSLAQGGGSSRSDGAGAAGSRQSRPGWVPGLGPRPQPAGTAGAPPPQPPSLSTGKDSSIVKSYSSTERTRRTYTGVRVDETHKSADTLNLDEFLAASHKVEAPRRAAGNPQGSSTNAPKLLVKKDDTASSYF
jgi:hypothetical protein